MKIYHAKIVTPAEVVKNGTVVIEDGYIAAIEDHPPSAVEAGDVDAKGSWLLPGFVDSHSDAIEIEMEPRPTSKFPIELSFFELEKKLVGEGITTIFHALSLTEGNSKRWVRQNKTVYGLIENINRLSKGPRLIRHKTHLRYEIANTEAVSEVEKLIRSKRIDQFSLMDHTPGQGQFRDIEVQKRLLIDHRHYTAIEAAKIIEQSRGQAKLDPDVLKYLAGLANRQGIPLASHDDDTLEKLDVVFDWNAAISEFPITLDVARKAKERGLFVVMGAPNVLLGKSHSNNVSAIEAIENGAVDILCSDYYPASLLHAIFKLYYRNGMPLPQAVNMVTLNPAKALKLDHAVGSIDYGKKADLLIVGENKRRPVLETVLVNGNIVCRLNYHTPQQASLSI